MTYFGNKVVYLIRKYGAYLEDQGVGTVPLSFLLWPYTLPYMTYGLHNFTYLVIIIGITRQMTYFLVLNEMQVQCKNNICWTKLLITCRIEDGVISPPHLSFHSYSFLNMTSLCRILSPLQLL
jgi:hypothetical protein